MEYFENSSSNIKCTEPSGSFSEESHLVLSSNSLVSPISKSQLGSSLWARGLTCVSSAAPFYPPHIDRRGGAERTEEPPVPSHGCPSTLLSSSVVVGQKVHRTLLPSLSVTTVQSVISPMILKKAILLIWTQYLKVVYYDALSNHLLNKVIQRKTWILLIFKVY